MNFIHCKGIYHYGNIYIHSNVVWKFCGGHLLINFFFGCIIDTQTNFKKNRREHASQKADKQFKAFLSSFWRTLWMLVSYVSKKSKMFFP